MPESLRVEAQAEDGSWVRQRHVEVWLFEVEVFAEISWLEAWARTLG